MVLLVVESFFLLGIVVPVRIEGSSMAPTLLGERANVACPHCEWAFDVAADQLSRQRGLWCPACDQRFPLPEVVALRQGDRVMVDRTRYVWGPPRRWDVVVLHPVDRPEKLSVKRVVGLPGEQVEFRHGDLWVDGQVVHKGLPEQLRQRLLIHTDREELRWWRADSPHWMWDRGAWRHGGDAPATLRLVPPGKQGITNELPTNQILVQPLAPVADLMVTCHATFLSAGTLELRAEFAEGRVESLRYVPTGVGGARELLFSLFDQQLLLAAEDEVLERRVSAEPWPGAPRLELVATGQVQLEKLTLWRDLHYHTRPTDRPPAAGWNLHDGEYFVVGDNVARSSDSRNWPAPGLSTRQIVGGLLYRPR